jgi:hypothetical protein
MIRVALVASTYRSERFLPAWLDSLAALTIWPEAELVVIANDPEPAERSLLDAFTAEHAQARVEEVPREDLYRSWNRAIAASTAPLLAIANVDDLRTPGGLAAQVEALEADPAARFAYGPFTISRAFPPEPGPRIPATPYDRETFTRGMHLGPFFVWRRDPEPGLRYFDEQLRVGGDVDLAVRLALRGHGVAVSDDLGAYYDGGAGLSTGGTRQQIEKAVLELRYGIYDTIDYTYVDEAAEYRIRELLLPGERWVPAADVVPGYDELLRERRARWHAAGLRRFAREQGALARARRGALTSAVRLKHRVEARRAR